MFAGGIASLLLQSLHPLAMAGGGAQRPARVTRGAPAADEPLHRDDDLRDDRGRRGGHRPGACDPRAGPRSRRARTRLSGQRPAPAPLGPHRRDRLLPPRLPGVRRPSPEPARDGPLCRADSRCGLPARRPGAPDRRSVCAAPSRRTARNSRGPQPRGKRPGSCCSSRRCRSSHGPATGRSPPAGCHCYPTGREPCSAYPSPPRGPPPRAATGPARGRRGSVGHGRRRGQTSTARRPCPRVRRSPGRWRHAETASRGSGVD